MFTLAATPVKLVALLVLFAFCTIWCGYELTRRQDRTNRVSNALHLVMAVVMLLMVVPATWRPLTAVVPMPALVVLFAAGVVWFAVLSIRGWRTAGRGQGLHLAGHAVMFAAMTWHVAAMAAMAAARAGGSGMGHGGGMGQMGAMTQPAPVMVIFAIVGLPLMAYLAAATVVAVAKLFRAPGAAEDLACHEPRRVGSAGYRLAALSDAAMNGGMFWMSTGLLVPVLPFFAALSF